MRPLPRRRSRAGFTLIEILAVMVILAILSVFLLRSGADSIQAVEIRKTEAFLQEIGALIDDYENEFSAYPPSTFPADLENKPSRVNEGIEALVLSLWRKDAPWQAREVDPDKLGNTDGDTTGSQSQTSMSSPDAFELLDVWGNPIAYIHRRDYGREFTYLSFDEQGNEVEGKVKALVSPKTGDPYRKRSFQLLSAGPDGLFGNEDDLANFEIER